MTRKQHIHFAVQSFHVGWKGQEPEAGSWETPCVLGCIDTVLFVALRKRMVENVLAADLSGSQHLHMFFHILVNGRSTASNIRCRVAKRRFFLMKLPHHAGGNLFP